MLAVLDCESAVYVLTLDYGGELETVFQDGAHSFKVFTSTFSLFLVCHCVLH